MSLLIQGFATRHQMVPVQTRPVDRGGLGLGEPARQLVPNQMTAIYEMPFMEQTNPASKLQVMKRKRFTPQGRAERIERSLAALNQPETLRLTPEEWRFFAEDPDLDDQD